MHTYPLGKQINTVTLIGSGGVATHLGVALYQAGIRINQVYSRTLKNAGILSESIEAKAIDNLNKLSNDADLYIFSIKDSAYNDVLNSADWSNKFCVHTAGSLPMDILTSHCNEFGVFYPLQTFSKHKTVHFKNIPIFIEGSSEQNELALSHLAQKLSPQVEITNSDGRKSLHIAAVFACNFTNYMLTLAEQIMEEYALPFEYIKPLIQETFEKAMLSSPFQGQTGPAKRNDQLILNNHLQQLEKNPKLKEVYKLLSEQIKQTYNNGN